MGGEWPKAIWPRVKRLVQRRKLESDLEEELRFHLAMREEKNRRAGLAADDAHSAARRGFGNFTLLKERCREMWTFHSLETFWQDVKYGARMLRKNSGMTLIATLTLALGIGVNTTIFTVVNGLLLRKPPVQDADRMMIVSGIDRAAADHRDRAPVSAPDYLDWRAESNSFSDMAVTADDMFTVSGGASPERATGTRVSPNYFQVLGVAPAIGRTILPGEDQAGHDQVVILSDDLWNERFGGDPKALGRKIKINGNYYVVIGVMPPSFHLAAFPTKLWVPLVLSRDNLGGAGRGERFLTVFARLKPGMSVRQARTEMETIAQRLAEANPETNRDWGANVMSLQEYTVEDSGAQAALAFLMAAVAGVLLIACANLANLLLARNSARQREFSIRAVMGAGRIRLARQLLTESVLLALGGGCLGILVAIGSLRVLLARFNWNEDAVATAKEIVMDTNVLAFTIAISLVAALLFGLAPALQMTRRDASTGLRDGGRGTTAGRERHRLQRLLVIGQLALSIFLLVGTSLFVEGFIEELRASGGFNPHNVLTASVSLRGLEYLKPERQKQFFESVVEKLRALPGAESAVVATDIPFDFPGDVQFTVEGHPAAKPAERPHCGYFAVGPGYFATTQIPMLQGRDVTAADTGDSPPIAIVNEAFAREYFPGMNPIGRHIQIGQTGQTGGGGQPVQKWSEIVGVVGNVNEFLGQTRPRPELFVPFAANPSDLARLVMRTRTNPLSMADPLRSAVWAVDADQAVTEVRTMERAIIDSGSGDDLMTGLMGSFAGIALVMAAIGIYGVLSYLVGERTHEMGIRMALGAKPGEVMRLVIRNGMTLVGTGVAAGFAASLALPKLVAANFQLPFRSAMVLAAAPPVVILIGLVACYIPARRAMRVDPMVALRHE